MVQSKEGQTVYTTETVYNDETGLPAHQFTYLNGVVQSPPDDSPAYVLFDKQGQVRRKVWYQEGNISRIGGPATISINPENGIHTVENWVVDSVTTRSRTEPAIIVRDAETGAITSREYFIDGVKFPAPKQISLDP